MMRWISSIALLSLAATAAALPPPPPRPIVTGIAPGFGKSGTVVRITGRHLDPFYPCTSPGCIVVSFGDVPVRAETISLQEISVIAPRNDTASTVDLTIRVAGRDPTIVRDAFSYAHNAEGPYEAIVLPVLLDNPRSGLYGSVWRTDLILKNTGSEPIDLVTSACEWHCESLDGHTTRIEPGQSLRRLPPAVYGPEEQPSRDDPGRMIYVRRDLAANLVVSLRLRSGEDAVGGQDLPIVRERLRRTGKVTILNVPIDPRARVHLRLYATRIYEYLFGRPFLVTVHDTKSGDRLLRWTLYAHYPVVRSIAFDEQPAYAELAGIEGLLSTIRAGVDNVWIEVEDLHRFEPDEPPYFQAIVSVTDNVTHHVSVILPQ